jgi:hypothetical protein
VYIEVDNGDNVRFPVRVQVDDSELQLLEQDIPSEISISESKEIEIVVANNRPNTVSGVNVFVKSTNNELEFTPEGIFIGNLEAYEQRAVDFTLTPLLKVIKTSISKRHIKTAIMCITASLHRLYQ